MRRLISILIGTFLLLAAGSVSASEGVGVYFEPIVGFYSVTLKTLEIETSFLNVGNTTDDEEEEIEWLPIEETVFEPSVGRKAFYRGNGVGLGGSVGLNLFNTSLGFVYIWHGVSMDGYSKRYRLSLEAQGAGGRLFWDDGVINLHRMMGQIWHRLPIMKIQIDFLTRIGGMVMDQGPLIVGRAIETVNAFTGDVGLGLSIAPNPFLNIGITGIFGFYTFSGKYEGAYGTIAGMEAKIVINL